MKETYRKINEGVFQIPSIIPRLVELGFICNRKCKHINITCLYIIGKYFSLVFGSEK